LEYGIYANQPIVAIKSDSDSSPCKSYFAPNFTISWEPNRSRVLEIDLATLPTLWLLKPLSEAHTNLLTGLKDKDGRQVTPSVKDQPIEEGRARDNNARRFVRKIDGIEYVYERIKSPEAYRKVQAPPNDITSDGDDEDDGRMDDSL
jgi:hypothetical protein